MNNNKSLYFIKCGDYVKIGTSRSVKDRIDQLQTGNPQEIEVLAVFEEQAFREYAIHKTFVHLNIRGEWFRYTEEIENYLKVLEQREYEFKHWDEIIDNIRKVKS